MGRFIWMFAALCMLAGRAAAQEDPLLGLPRMLSLQEPVKANPEQEQPVAPQESPDAVREQPAGEGELLLDFDRFEAMPYVGFLFFSEDYEADPELAVGVTGRAPSPWFSRDVLGLDEDLIGGWLDLRVSKIDRDGSLSQRGNRFHVEGQVGLEPNVCIVDDFDLANPIQGQKTMWRHAHQNQEFANSVEADVNSPRIRKTRPRSRRARGTRMLPEGATRMYSLNAAIADRFFPVGDRYSPARVRLTPSR